VLTGVWFSKIIEPLAGKPNSFIESDDLLYTKTLERRLEMSKKFAFKTMVLSILLILPLMLGIALSGYAQEPPPGSKITGKAAEAVFTAVVIQIAEIDVVVQTIVGTCNKIPFVIGPLIDNPVTPANIGGVTKEQMEGIFLENVGPAGCYSEFGGEDLVISKVSRFSNAEVAIGAEISLRKVE
jgi:hypothetical protein